MKHYTDKQIALWTASEFLISVRKHTPSAYEHALDWFLQAERDAHAGRNYFETPDQRAAEYVKYFAFSR
jgi:hypothetical protein